MADQYPRSTSAYAWERRTWGGVDHANPSYMRFDLEAFADANVPPATAQDLILPRQVLEVARTLPTTARARDLERSLRQVIRSNKGERKR